MDNDKLNVVNVNQLELNINELKEYLNSMDVLAKMLFENSLDAGVITDLNGNMIKLNAKVNSLLGYSENELKGRCLFTLLNDEDVKASIKHFNMAICSKVEEKLYKIIDKDKKTKYVKTTIIPLNKGKKSIGMYFILKDITDEINLQKEIDYISNYDSLTGLLNVQAFQKRVERDIRKSSQNLVLLLLDINRFKFINDSLGYSLGDEVLKKIAFRLKEYVKEEGFIARLSGDKFFILLNHIQNKETIECFLNTLKDIFKVYFDINNTQLYITFSVGVTVFPQDGKDVLTLMKNADIALHNAKKKCENSYVLYNSMLDKENFKNFYLQNDLRYAIDRRQLIVHYQPRVDGRTNKIIGAEALVRWNHPIMGMLFPAEFITLAEESDAVIRIGQWTLDIVCSLIRKLINEGANPPKISINFSLFQFIHSDVPKTIEDALIFYELEGDYLEIEITEGTIKHNEKHVLNSINAIRDLGVFVALDDFGGNNSFLCNLKDLEIDTLKISRSFVKDIPQDVENSKIITAMINLAHSLNMNVVANGVETLLQLNWLMNMNCSVIQGHLYSKAISEEEFKKLLKIGVCYPKESIIDYEGKYENRREFFRLNLKKPLGADMSIFKIGGKKVELGYTEVIVLDIGPGGLRFLSDMKIPVRADIILVFETEILSSELQLYGRIAWMRICEENIYEYGLEFILEEKQREALLQLLNQLQIQLKNHKGVNNYRVVKRVYIKENYR